MSQFCSLQPQLSLEEKEEENVGLRVFCTKPSDLHVFLVRPKL